MVLFHYFMDMRLYFQGFPYFQQDDATTRFVVLQPCSSNVVIVHSSFVLIFHFFKKICCFLHWIQSINLIFMLPYILMDVPIFVIAEWATLLVDIRCPRGGS